jgi:hypothetical protein
MPTLGNEVWQNVYRARRKTVWRRGDLRLMMRPVGRVGQVVLELERMEKGKAVEQLWAGQLRAQGNAVVLADVTAVRWDNRTARKKK